MGARGPAPTPTNILEKRGSWRSKRNPAEPKPPVVRPRCPTWLHPMAKTAYRVLARQLEELNVITKLDRLALARYCQIFARWRIAEADIDKNGSVYVTVDKAGNKFEHLRVFVKIAAQLADQLGRLEREFGLTPSARSRLTIEVDEAIKTNAKDKARFLKLG